MNKFLKKPGKYQLLLFLLVFIFATFFYIFKLGFSDLWSDEIYTKSMLNGSLSDFYAKFRNDLHPPLYYLGLRLFTSVFGTNVITLRLFSVLGILSTLLLGYFTGQRIFGKQGALYFCLLLISIPMLSTYSHQARMYTWATFTVTGVFMYSCLYLNTGKRRDLFFLFLFTVLAMYVHYYSLAAAFSANLFVFLYLFFTKNKKWRQHLISSLLAVALFLPWLFMFFVQINKVQHAFWAPEVSLAGIFSCITIPFTEQFWTTTYAYVLTILMYALIVITIFISFSKSLIDYRLALWLSLSIFFGTLFLVTLISLFSQPILSTRYVMAIVSMLVVAPTILLIRIKATWVKILLLIAIFMLNMRISASIFSFSYGPYKQTIEYVTTNYPEIKKMVHVTEVTAGPLIEYSKKTDLTHYWLKAEMSNVDAFTEVHQYSQPSQFLQPNEQFCAVRFNNLELNIKNLNRIISESELLKIDTISDNKFKNGIFIQLYLLKYEGE
ncbi:glycosyltransferase family 39 protein [uncultured Draconibacterium sp.]|uniref:glycosyltransferase family 39 protein n=1 Tax=uncultured Draconibacterium sp. TaxID=1573823 RepID=UPI0029C7449F|nr:glycosyltransferase family 39 protein [uncultured Draconibacterium sp.]